MQQHHHHEHHHEYYHEHEDTHARPSQDRVLGGRSGQSVSVSGTLKPKLQSGGRHQASSTGQRSASASNTVARQTRDASTTRNHPTTSVSDYKISGHETYPRQSGAQSGSHAGTELKKSGEHKHSVSDVKQIASEHRERGQSTGGTKHATSQQPPPPPPPHKNGSKPLRPERKSGESKPPAQDSESKSALPEPKLPPKPRDHKIQSYESRPPVAPKPDVTKHTENVASQNENYKQRELAKYQQVDNKQGSRNTQSAYAQQNGDVCTRSTSNYTTTYAQIDHSKHPKEIHSERKHVNYDLKQPTDSKTCRESKQYGYEYKEEIPYQSYEQRSATYNPRTSDSYHKQNYEPKFATLGYKHPQADSNQYCYDLTPPRPEHKSSDFQRLTENYQQQQQLVQTGYDYRQELGTPAEYKQHQAHKQQFQLQQQQLQKQLQQQQQQYKAQSTVVPHQQYDKSSSQQYYQQQQLQYQQQYPQPSQQQHSEQQKHQRPQSDLVSIHRYTTQPYPAPNYSASSKSRTQHTYHPNEQKSEMVHSHAAQSSTDRSSRAVESSSGSTGALSTAQSQPVPPPRPTAPHPSHARAGTTVAITATNPYASLSHAAAGSHPGGVRTANATYSYDYGHPTHGGSTHIPSYPIASYTLPTYDGAAPAPERPYPTFFAYDTRYPSQSYHSSNNSGRAISYGHSRSALQHPQVQHYTSTSSGHGQHATIGRSLSGGARSAQRYSPRPVHPETSFHV